MEEPLEHPPQTREGDDSVARTDDRHEDVASEDDLDDAPELDDEDVEDDGADA